MTIRIATFNAENLFRRPKVFRLPGDEQRREVLDDYAELVSLLERETYDDDQDPRRRTPQEAPGARLAQGQARACGT